MLSTWASGGGTLVSTNLLFVTFEEDHGIAEMVVDSGGVGNHDQVLHLTRPRLLLRKLGEVALGDRWDGELRVEGNKILVGKDQGHFSDIAGNASPYNNRAVVLRLQDGAVRPAVVRPCP